MAKFSENALKTFLEAPDASLRSGYKRLRRSLIAHNDALAVLGQKMSLGDLYEKLDCHRADLESKGIKPTPELCIASYLKSATGYDAIGPRDNFGEIRHYPAAALASSDLYINRARRNEFTNEFEFGFAASIQETLHNEFEVALSRPGDAAFYLQMLFTHDNGRQVRHSRVDMCIAILKHFIAMMDYSNLTLQKRYICTNSSEKGKNGIRTGTIEWIEIAKKIVGGTTHFMSKDASGKPKLVERPSSAFYGAVGLLVKHGVITSQKLARSKKQSLSTAKTTEEKRLIRALPSLKTIDKDFLLDCGVKAESLEKAQKIAKEGQISAFKRHLDTLKQKTLETIAKTGVPVKCAVSRLFDEAAVIKKALESGKSLFKSVCPDLGIPVVQEFRPSLS